MKKKKLIIWKRFWWGKTYTISGLLWWQLFGLFTAITAYSNSWKWFFILVVWINLGIFVGFIKSEINEYFEDKRKEECPPTIF